MRYSHLFLSSQSHELTHGISLEAQFTRTVAKWINTTINYYWRVDSIVIWLMQAINCIIEVCYPINLNIQKEQKQWTICSIKWCDLIFKLNVILQFNVILLQFIVTLLKRKFQYSEEHAIAKLHFYTCINIQVYGCCNYSMRRY